MDAINKTTRRIGGALLLFCTTTTPSLGEEFGLFTYFENLEGGVSISDYPENEVAPVTVPSVIAGKAVTGIASQAFKDCGIRSITLPNSITTLGNSCFADCLELEEVRLSPNIIIIPNSCFFRCPKLSRINMPERLAILEDQAFWGCSRLDNIELPAGVTSIERAAFGSCRSLRALTIPPQVTGLGSSVFSGCVSLTTMVLPDTLQALGNTLFSGCASLTRVRLPARLARIESSTFRNCHALTSILVPASVVDISTNAFTNCRNLTSITFLGNAPAIGQWVFQDTHRDITAYYFNSNIGFSSPTWEGISATAINEAQYPATPWLHEHGYPHHTDLHQDLNSDGVPLLLAWALNLDPNQPLQSELPKPDLTENALTLSFYCGTMGISYRVETSTDLQSWTELGVTLSARNPDHQCTASVDRADFERYLRLVVEQE